MLVTVSKTVKALRKTVLANKRLLPFLTHLVTFTVAGLYQDARNATDTVIEDQLASKTRGYELAAAYTYGSTVFSATYNYLEDKNASGNAADLADSIAVDATHYFNKNFRTYASYKFNNLDQAGDRSRAGTSDEFVLGARYDF